ncbi:hypothetical protein Tco_1549537 [Tanacetum coccineum]
MSSASSKKFKIGDDAVNVEAPSTGVPQEKEAHSTTKTLHPNSQEVLVPRRSATAEKVFILPQSTFPNEEEISEADTNVCLKYSSMRIRLSKMIKLLIYIRVVDWELLPYGVMAPIKSLHRLRQLSQDFNKSFVSGLVLHMFVDKKYPLFVNLIKRMLDHQLEICRGTVGNELTTAVQLIAFLKKQISDSKRPKVHNWYVNTPWGMDEESSVTLTWMISGFAVMVFFDSLLKFMEFWRFNIVAAGSRYVVPTGRVKVPAGREDRNTPDMEIIVSEYSGRYQTYPTSRNHQYACMTRSSTKELFTPFKDPGREFRSARKHSKTLSLDESRSPDFNLFSDQVEYSEEEIEDKDNFELKGQFLKELCTNTFSGLDHKDAYEHIKKVLEIMDLFYIPNITIDQVILRALPMSLTGAASPKKIEEINNFQQEPDENIYQDWERFKELLMKCPQHYLTEMQEVVLFFNGLDVSTRQVLDSRGAIPSKIIADAKKVNEKVYAAQVGCEQCKGPHYTKDCPLKEEGKSFEEDYYTQFGAPFQGGGYRATALGFYQRNNANPSHQERRQSMEDTLSKFMSESAKRHEENSNLIKEIRASTDATIRNQGASIKTLEIEIGQMSKSYRKEDLEVYRAPLKLTRETMSSRSQLFRLNGYYCEEKKGSYGPQFSKAYSEASHINNSIPRKEKDPRSFTLPCYINNVCFNNALADLGASVSDMPFSTYLNLGLGELAHTKFIVELADRTVKYPKGIAENVLVVLHITSHLEARLMGETLMLNRSLDPLNEDYIELNDLNEPLEFRRNQGGDLIPAIKEGKIIEEFRTRDDELDIGIDDYPRYCDCDKKIRIDCAHNLRFSCMIGFEFIHVNFFLLLYVNVMSKKFHNSIMKDKLMYKGNNVVGALMSMPIFVGTFSVVTDFAILEDMDGYRDEGMGDVIFGEPVLREVGINAKWCEGTITIHNANEEVTYQMKRSHPRFKHHTNEQCKKIWPLLKVSKEDKMNGIAHSYQKLKSFYKGVLNLRPEYVRDVKIEEWLTRGHISVHELE